MILVDTNVLIDLLFDDPIWNEWSKSALNRAHARDQLVVNDVIFAEICPNFSSATDAEAELNALGLARSKISDHALFTASKAFMKYKKLGGTKLNVLPDFFIGAQAQTEGWTLLTRDAGRFKTYFPQIKLITPETV